MKCLIYQVYMGDELELYNFCTESVKEYCKKYSIDHIIQKQPILKIIPDLKVTNRSVNSHQRLGYLPIYEKENAFAHLAEYDKISVIDSDVYIRKNAPNIFDELRDEVFAAVVEREMPLIKNYRNKIRSYSNEQYGTLTDVDWKWNDDGAEFMNMGIMMFSKELQTYLRNDTPKEFIQRKEFKRFVDGLGFWKWSTDQTLLNYWIRKEKMKLKNLDWKWNTLYNAVDKSLLKEAYFIHFFLRDHLPNKMEHVKKFVNQEGIE